MTEPHEHAYGGGPQQLSFLLHSPHITRAPAEQQYQRRTLNPDGQLKLCDLLLQPEQRVFGLASWQQRQFAASAGVAAAANPANTAALAPVIRCTNPRREVVRSVVD
jgi:hypothetical protein